MLIAVRVTLLTSAVFLPCLLRYQFELSKPIRTEHTLPDLDCPITAAAEEDSPTGIPLHSPSIYVGVLQYRYRCDMVIIGEGMICSGHSLLTCLCGACGWMQGGGEVRLGRLQSWTETLPCRRRRWVSRAGRALRLQGDFVDGDSPVD